METSALLRAFEDGTLPAAGFHHLAHLTVAWVYLDRYGVDEAARRLADALRRFAARAGRPEKFNDALTRAWVAAIDDARRAHPDAVTLEAVLVVRPDLLDRASVRERNALTL